MQVEELALDGKKLRLVGNWLLAWWDSQPLRLSLCQEDSDGDWLRHEDMGLEFGNTGCSLPTDESVRMRVYLLVIDIEFRFRVRNPFKLWRKLGNG